MLENYCPIFQKVNWVPLSYVKLASFHSRVWLGPCLVNMAVLPHNEHLVKFLYTNVKELYFFGDTVLGVHVTLGTLFNLPKDALITFKFWDSLCQTCWQEACIWGVNLLEVRPLSQFGRFWIFVGTMKLSSKPFHHML